MPKFSVKKPYTVVVGVVMLLILGFISFTKMTTDLLPQMELPYVMVMATYPGATPERVEANVTKPLEGGLGTVNGVKNVMSTSSENFSLVFLEFDEGTNMDSAMVKLSSALDLIQLPDMVGTPMLLELSPDMLPTMVVSVDYDGKDIYELSEFAEDIVVPYLERQDGTANVETAGLIHQYIEVRLDQAMIDEINDDLLAQVNEKLDDAKKELDDGIAKLEEAKEQMAAGKKELENQQNATANQLAEASKQLNQALATKAAYEAQVTTLQAQKAALEAERAAYQQVMDGIYQQILESFDKISADIQSEAYYNKVRVEIVSQVTGRTDVTYENVQEVMEGLDEETRVAVENAIALRIQTDLAQVPKDLWELVTDEAKREAFIEQLKNMGDSDLADQLTPEMLQGIYQVVLRVTQLDSGIANLNTEILTSQAVLDQVSALADVALNQYNALEAGKITAAAGFGAAAAQIASGEATLTTTETQLEEAKKSFEEAREAAMKNANLDALLNMDTLAGILTAQNFEMPAGYIKDGDTQYMLKVGDELGAQEELENLLLVSMDGIGDVRLKDVAQITMIDNAGEAYTKVNGNDAVALTITKASTAGTSAVSKTCNEALAELEEKYPGLHVTPLMDQGDYIELIVGSVLNNLMWGAVLAIIVLIVFLKDAKPTIVVAVSIPFSVLFAIVLMYFSGITLNVLSLSGLALGVGMLVDNSIVVIENIYRLRSKGMPAARAAVVGANQVAGAIAASTLTTVCVFLPIVFVEGLTRDLLQDMGLTIAYSLLASLIIALTLVPTMGATVLKNCAEKEHKWFDAMMGVYEKALRFCLRVKIVPLTISVALLVFSIYQMTQIGIVLLPEMGGNQVSITVTAPEEAGKEEAYALADDAMARVMTVEGIDAVGAMSGGGLASMLGGGSGEGMSFTFYVILEDEAAKQGSKVVDKIEESLTGIDGEAAVAASGMNQMTDLLGSGMSVSISGPDLDQMLAIGDEVMAMLDQVEGFTEISNGQEEADSQIIIHVDKEQAMKYGLTVAQVYAELAGQLTTEKTATTLNVGLDSYEVEIVDETNVLMLNGLLDYEFKTTTTNADGEQIEESHKLSEFAELEEAPGVTSINRTNQSRYLTISATVEEGYNVTLQSREFEELLAKYEVPEGYTISMGGEVESVGTMLKDMGLMILVACAFIYLIMVAQFQSLMSPFIVLFTIPLAFTGGLLALLLAGEALSIVGLVGFLILAGVVVNNGIVFVDYANQLRLEGMEKIEALVETGMTRMRPILMTALTTILAMCTMAMSNDEAAVIGRGMAIVSIGGLAYATFMTLFIVPVLYDLFFRKELKKVDLGDESNLVEE